jgi:hypothetical protein
MNLEVGLQERRRDVQERRLRRRNLQVIQQRGGQKFVNQDPAVLRIVAELHYVPVAVVGLEQVCLGASSHFADLPDGSERHRKENRVP